MRRIAPPLAVALAAGLLLPAAAGAAKQLSFTLVPVGQPSYFRFAAKPKQVVRGTLVVKSNASSTRTILLRPADVGTGATGGLTYGTGKPHRVGRWVHLKRHKVDVPAGGSVAVSFTVKVPPHPGKGQRFAGIVGIDRLDLLKVRRKPQPRAGRPLSLKFLPRFAMTVQLNLPGRRTKHVKHSAFSIKVTPSGVYINVPLTNDGNSLINESSGSATISRGAQALVTQAVELSQFVPGTSIDYLLKVPGRPVEGTYDVTGFLQPQGAPRSSLNGSATFGSTEASQFKQQTGKEAKGGATTTPWLIIVLFLIVLVLAFAVARSYLRLRHERVASDRYDPHDWQ